MATSRIGEVSAILPDSTWAQKKTAANEKTGVAPKQAAPPQDMIKMKEALQQLLTEMSSLDHMRMEYDASIKRVVVSVMDGSGERVIRQIPSEELIDFARRFSDYLGSIINRRA
jgi:uncharacterized FlaG/YvyC family protein